jgi:hypothetical protein
MFLQLDRYYAEAIFTDACIEWEREEITTEELQNVAVELFDGQELHQVMETIERLDDEVYNGEA